MSDAEYDAAVHFAGVLAFTARSGPSYDEVRHFPWWKRLAMRLTPTRHRWRYSEFAPILRERLRNQHR